MKNSKRSFAVLGIFLFSQFVFSQGIPTSTLTGKITMEDRTPLPGVLVTVESPSLQGKRDVSTSSAGDYIFNLLPPGEYTVMFAMDGMQTVERKITLTAASTGRIDLQMRPKGVAEAVTVRGETPAAAILESTQVSANYNQKFIEKLPVLRTLQAVTLLAPGVNDNGPGDNIMMSGGMSFENLFLLNGVVVNENLRGQPQNLFIEDAIAETTVLTASVSAEYGRFTGGVVNAITRSGGNKFFGSFRTSFTNEKWTQHNPHDKNLGIDPRIDNVDEVYEGTLGGPVWKDRIWFFGAGRLSETNDTRQTRPTARDGDINPTPIVYPHGFEEERIEGKLTGAITSRHNLIASYIDIERDEQNQSFTTNNLDLGSLVPLRKTPNSLLGLNYNGVLSDKLFVEAQYSRREFAFVGGGSPHYDLIQGTLLQDRARGARFNSPTFKKTRPELRNNESYLIKGSYFLSTGSLGTHDIRVGYEDFSEVRDVNNYQSGSDYRITVRSAIIRGTEVFPIMSSTGSDTRIIWNPIFVLTKGSDYATRSAFINDRINFNQHWSFNLGLRYDKNDAVDGRGAKLADDDAFSPRLAAHYDVRGDGKHIVNASYGQYVAKLSEGTGNDADPAGRAASFQWNYRGDPFNTNVNASTSELVPTHVAIRRVFEWFFANGGTGRRPYRSPPSIPGFADRIAEGGLRSPNMKEYTLGFGSAFGTRGFGRVDLIYRDWDDFYAEVTNISNGRSEPHFVTGDVFDVSRIGNSDTLERKYTAVQTQFNYRFGKNFSVGGNYTWSRLTGNFTGEDSGSGPLTSSAESYPEYREESWNYPTGYITGDQRHRARLWLGYDLTTRFGEFNVSLVESYDSGTAYSLDGTVDPRGPTGAPYFANPGYLLPPSSISYFFGPRGALRTDDITSTDLAFNYSVKLFRKLELFLQPEVLNAFNERGRVSLNDEVITAESSSTSRLLPFNPFTQKPMECTTPDPNDASRCAPGTNAHYLKGQNFGKPTAASHYQLPRTFRFSVGLRF